MKLAGIIALPDVELGQLPYWRQALRGFSQCAFQANENTALFFVTAATIYNWQMGAAYVVSVLVATLVARLLGGIPDLLGLGLYGFNSGLMGLALLNFFVPSPVLWGLVPVLAAVVAAVTVLMSKKLPFPFLAAPFISVFWIVFPFADALGLKMVEFSPFSQTRVWFYEATIAALGATLFASGLPVGLLFLAGVLVSNWRHGVVAMMGALLAASLATFVGAKGAAINSGFVGFNAVLGAIATYAIVAPDLRLAALAALFSTWIFGFFFRHFPAPALASGFVLTVWLILVMGWLNTKFNETQPAPQK
ncbi:MAG TPA: urea transporter [Polyangiales bacterium]|nr:urea transporter [Polyangiales bacterium]